MNAPVKHAARAFAPASDGNAIAGFDLLGHSIHGPRDTVTVRRIDSPEVRIDAIRGCATGLPTDPQHNTAGAALMALRRALDLDFGFAVELDKGIPFGSGMGGSAASCVAALVAANELLDHPLTRHQLYPLALAGEAASSGGLHGDNLGPMLLGGLCLSLLDRLVELPVPEGLTAVLVHPEHEIETRHARSVLNRGFALPDVVCQSGHLTLLMAGLYQGDFGLVAAGLDDVLVMPRRACLIPGFDDVRSAALGHNALGAGISGAGPSMVAWFQNREQAELAAAPMQQAFAEAGVNSRAFVSSVAGPAAGVLP